MAERGVRSLVILAWMVLPVVAGFVAWRLRLSRLPEGHAMASRLARGFSQASILGVIPPMVCLVFWTAELPAGPSVVMPFLGLGIHLLGGAAGWAVARIGGHPTPIRGACFLAGASSNVLTFGSIVAVLLLSSPSDPHGEQALGAMQLYRVFEAPFYYIVAWPAAAILSEHAAGKGWTSTFRSSFRPVTLLPIAAMAAGMALNLGGVPRPALFDGASALLVKVNVTLLGLTVGLTLRRAAPRKWAGCCAGIGLVKFVLLPLSAVGLAWMLGFRGIHLQVAAVCASMPVAFMAVVGANLVGLDEEVLGSLWLTSTSAMAGVVPVLAFVLPLLG